MCGRYTLRKGLSDIAEKLADVALTLDGGEADYDEARFNIAPTQSCVVIRNSFEKNTTLAAVRMRWGLVPSWSKATGSQSLLINARSETVSEKPSFRAAYKRRRCLVPADGFYEWKNQRGSKTPYHFGVGDQELFFMAGIWENWVSEENDQIDSFTILTTFANSLMAGYHDRMPVILKGEKTSIWLHEDVSSFPVSKLKEIYLPIDAECMFCSPANPEVNSNKAEGPSCLEPPEEQEDPQFDLGF